MGGLGIAEIVIIIIILAIGIVAMLPWFFIYKKAGYSPAMGCLMFIPIVNIIMLFILAFSQWPVERELQNAKNGIAIEPKQS